MVISRLLDIKTVQDNILKKIEAIPSTSNNKEIKEKILNVPFSDLKEFLAFDKSIDEITFKQLVSTFFSLLNINYQLSDYIYS